MWFGKYADWAATVFMESWTVQQEIHERVISLFWGFAWLPVVPYWNNQLMTDSNPLQGSNHYRALEPAVNITMNSDLNNPPTRRQRNKSHNPQQDGRWLRMVCYNSPWWGLYRRRCWMIWWCRNTILVSLFKIRFLVLFYPVELYVNRLLLKVVWVGGGGNLKQFWILIWNIFKLGVKF